MKGDFSRKTFDRSKHYNGVEMQQGRVQLDADWNEQGDIVRHRIETEALDVIGPSGGPIHDAAFAIAAEKDLSAADKKSLSERGFKTLVANDIYLGPGRYYVDGLLCENEALVPLTGQPDLFDVTAPAPNKSYIVYLDVWERHITALDDPRIREVALGGPDTATRRRVVWQVKLADPAAKDHCLVPVAGTPSTGLLTASLEKPQPNADECVVPESADYRNLENQLYRVEVHAPGPLGTATFKWSRDNGTIVTAILSIDVDNNKKIAVADLGRDELLGFRADDWVEITDDGTELAGKPGTLFQIDGAPDPVGRTITLKAAPSINFARNPKLRRWDQPSDAITTAVGPLDLEYGVQVSFSGGKDDQGNDRYYNTGDYWLIPARTANGDPRSGKLDWPTQPDGKTPLAVAPLGIQHHYARLATLAWKNNAWAITDCRHLFPPITELTSFFYLGGDGQEAEIDPLHPSALIPLAEPLQVGVANGSWPVAGAPVKFTVVTTGRLVDPATNADVTEVIVPTADGTSATPKGVAAVVFKLDPAVGANFNPKQLHQQVIATLLDASGATVHLPITFTATLERDAPALYYAGGDGQEAHRGRRLPSPLRVLVSDEWGTIQKATVQFAVLRDASAPFAEQGTVSNGSSAEAASVLVQTTPAGVAECYWTPSANATTDPTMEYVVATLVDPTTTQPIAGQGTINFYCHDLSFHNRHLHGYGIVCGLQVYCGPDQTNPNGETVHDTITVRNGYAIDSFGKDIIVDAGAAGGDQVKVLDLIRSTKLLTDPADPTKLTDGAVSLILRAAATAAERYAVEPYDPKNEGFSHAFDGTFWSDVWADCIRPVYDVLAKDAQGNVTREQMIVLLNAMAPLVDAQHGPHVFISDREDQLLRAIYDKLRAVLKSKTFCAFADAPMRALPAYDIYDAPGARPPATVFGTVARQRMRLSPSGQYAFLIGDDDRIQIFSVVIGRERLVVELQFPSTGAVVQDVAFTVDGAQMFAVATGTSGEAQFAIADVKSDATNLEAKWRGAANRMSDFPLVTVAFSARQQAYYAVSPGRGLFQIDFAGKVQPIAQFNALKHLVVGDFGDVTVAFATINNGSNQYQSIARIQISAAGQGAETDYTVAGPPATDDIAIAATVKPPVLAAVVGPDTANGQRSKRLALYRALPTQTSDVNAFQFVDLGWTPPPNDQSSVDASAYSLAYHARQQRFLIASGGEFLLKTYNLGQKAETIDAYAHPVQIAPAAVAATDPKTNYVAVLNGGSTTISNIPDAFVAGTAKVSLDKLATYHAGVVNAFIDVAGVLAQAIKDCLCDHLLVRCADDDPKAPAKPLYLARIDIRDQEVFNICNFSKRKYVHSFPTVEYWLSVVPILPIVRQLVEAFCCQAVMSAFGTATSDNLSARTGLLSPATILNGIAFAREFDWTSLLRTQVMNRAALLGSFSRATVSNFRFPSPAIAPQLKIDTVEAPAIVGQPETAAKQLLSDNSIVVTGTERFMPGVTDARAILLAPTELKPNDAVTLVVDANNTVVGYKPILAAAPPSIGTTAAGVAGPSIATTVPPHIVVELAKRDAQIAELTKSVTDLNNRHVGALAARDKQIAELSARLDAVAKQRPKRPR